MDIREKKHCHPIEKSSILSNLFFCWALPLFYKRYKHETTQDEFYTPSKSHESGKLGNSLEKIWEDEIKTNPNPSLWRALWKSYKWEFIAFGTLFIISEFVLKMSQPWLIGKLISQYTTTNSTVVSKKQTYIYSSLILITSFLSVVVGHTYLLKISHLGMKVRIACCSLIYRKCLKLNKAALGETTVGKMVNLLSNDVNRFDMAPMHLFQLFVAPIETIFVIGCLYVTVGSTAISGIAFLILFVPIQMYMGKLTSRFRSKTARKTDERVKLMNEVIQGIQVIKMYTWEKLFTEIIKKARKLEIRQIMKVSYLRAFNVSFMLFMNRTGIFLCILTYILCQNQLDAKYVFVVSSFYAILRQALTVYFPFGINNFSETRVSVGRIEKFLLSEEVPTKPKNDKKITTYVPKGDKLVKVNSSVSDFNLNNEKPVGVQLQNVSVKWVQSLPNYTLHNINFEASAGELIAIIGTVGSGKSTLLHSIMNEIPLNQGNLEVNGTISYASQEPWLFEGTIRDNILFGSEFILKRYQEIIEICGLREDLDIWPQIDGTMVGERGVLLSGGQKARINLARAIYKDADIYLLDDPFAAVDTKVGKQIFQNCILSFLKNKCRILVTHHLQYLGTANRVYVMEKGTITPSGTHQQLDILEETDDSEAKSKIVSNQETPKQETQVQKSGAVSKLVYRKYLLAGGNYFVVFLLSLLFIFAQSGASGADYFLAFWVNLNQSSENFFTTKICTYVYVGIIIFTIITSITRSLVFFRFCVKASKHLHDNMFIRIISAPVTFFNMNPSGRILNRFSKDMGLVDEILPTIIMETIQIAFVVCGSTLLITFLNPWMLIPTVIMVILFYFFRIVFLTTSRNLKRLEATTRSPVYSHINSSFQGLSTIRSNNAQENLKKEFDHFQNIHSSAFYTFLTCNRAFGFWLDMTCVFYVIIVVISIIFIDTSVGNIGLAIMQSMNLTGVLQWGIRQWSEMENQMICVERLVEYTEIVPEKNVDKEPPKGWPNKGNIEFQSVSLQYTKNEPLILDHITICIKSEEKIGIVGRTGAGKSSLISALFRLFNTKGKITIDGIDISTISLQNLRSKISIIPQEPTLFSGTLRENLDPFSEFSDETLWKVLEQVELKSAVLDLPHGLFNEIVTSGTNFSVGQKQLICLARAILRNNKILVLDEATANVDPQTDQAIRKTIKKNFQNCTVLTVAHRLHTIMNSDKVLVMDAGKVVEFDHPHRLVENTQSLFHQLVTESGVEMAEHLANMAKDDYEQKGLNQ